MASVYRSYFLEVTIPSEKRRVKTLIKAVKEETSTSET